MEKNWTWLVIVVVLIPLSRTSAQTASNRPETQQPFSIVPLTSPKDGRVSGEPGKPGAPFVIRIWNPTNYIVPPHWHPEDEHIVVVKGTWHVGMGDKFDRNALRELHVGDYALMPKKMPHFGWSETETIIQVHGIGPFQIIPVDAEEHLSGWKNDPQRGWVRDPQATSFFKFRITDHVRSKRGEGMIVGGMHSEKSKITQYDVHTDGESFFESEEDLAAVPQEKNLEPGPLTGAWEGVIHGAPQGEQPCMLFFQQSKGNLTGVFSLQWGGAAFKSATFKNNALEIHVETPMGNFVFKGEYRQGALSGDWSGDNGLKGTWEGKKVETATSR
jgi:hypothetical protein